MCRLARFDSQTKLGKSRHDDLAPDAISLTVIGSAEFVEPSRGQLPGGFVDPVGYFELVDTSLMSDCGSACKRDPVSGVIGVQKGTTIPMV